MRGQIALIFFVFLVLALIIMLIVYKAFVPYTQSFGALAGTNSLASNSLNNGFNELFGLYDNSILFIMIAIVGLDILIAYINPTFLSGIVNVFLLLLLVFMSAQIQNNVVPALKGIGLSTFPNAFNFFTSVGWFALLFFGLIISIIMNFRGYNNRTSSYPSGMG